ncbi:MAG: hypothetical protein ACR2PK_10315 [Acidimicrobiales bacterium]
MDWLILRILPVAIRANHGGELEDMLATSTRPVRDRADIAIAGVGLRLGRAMRPLLVAAAFAMCGFGFALVRVVGHLRYGFGEIPEHWWSTLIAGGFTGSLIASTVLAFASRSVAIWNTLR